jgi:isopentenyl-diphosphate delta-isomerase
MGNPLEKVDILDTEGKKTKTVTKAVAHEHGLLHACVIGHVINSDGRWLLVKQASDRQDAGQYVFPIGGHVTSGEKDEEALIREAEEELGYLSSDYTFELLGKKVYNREVIGRKENHLFVVYKVMCDAKPILGDEADEYTYFSIDEVQTLMKANREYFGDAFYFVYENFNVKDQ